MIIGSLDISVIENYCCTGPVYLPGVLTGSFVELYGCRPVMLVGGAVMAAAFFISAFVPNVDCLYFVYGVFGGK